MGAVAIERLGEVAVVRFDRPPANAIELGSARELGEAVERTARDESVRALVLTGVPGLFSAGLDLKLVPQYGAAEQREMVLAIDRFVLALYGAPLPTVAAVSGHAIAGGLVVALTCDHRVGAAGAFRIGLTESRVAVPYPLAAMAVVRAELAPPVARALVLRGRNVAPEEAVRLGVLDEVVPAADCLERALAVARDLAQIPRDGYARIKRQLREETISRIERCVATGEDPLAASWLTAEAAPAAQAMLAKRGE
ncbi:MAG TPA: enoyl-CoA hydratase/isomerase family protein [Candidatus Binatia bacterium]|nr:enoyl-CoA hydratase/isomerase family protein [Candidatus Binatia bacterium]